MKHIYVLLLSLFATTAFAQKFQALDYSNFDKTDLKTDLFIENTSPLSAIGKAHDTYNMYSFVQMYKEFANNDKLNRFDKFDEIQRISQPTNYSNTVKIGLIHLEYESLNKANIVNQDVEVLEDNKVHRVSNEYFFTQTQTTVIAPLSITKRGLATTYILEADYFVNNTSEEISVIKADFGDGLGMRAIDFNSPIAVNYANKGDKTLVFDIILSNGEVIRRHSSIKIEHSNTDLNNIYFKAPSEVTSTLTADLSAYAGATLHQGLVEYEIFLGADNVLDKPIFIVDGFDPSDTRTVAGIYSLLDFDNGGTPENLADTVRNEDGYDVVIINFPSYFRLSNGVLQSMANSTDVNLDTVIDVLDYPGSTLVDGGADFIERNALSVVEILNIVNAQKVGTEQNVVIGPSMGGLITRYALSYMENDPMTLNLDHETRLWMSFDSPHLGANVPIGFQHLFNYLGYGLDTWVGDFSMEAVRPIVDGMLKSPAARQMLTDHFEPHLANGSIADFDPAKLLPEAHPYFTTFYASVNALTTSGFPELTRNVSLVNGSGIGTPYQHKNGTDILPGDRVLDAFLPSVATLTDAYFDTWFMPTAGTTIKIDDVWIDAPWICFCDIHAEPDARANTFSDGVDAAPGGLFDLGALAAGFGGTDPTMDAFFAALTTDYFNFIPVVSAMALNTNPNIDWHQNINLGAGDTPWDGVTNTNSQTPFVNWYMPDLNEAHVTLTQPNVQFSLDEILKKADVSAKAFLQGAALNPNVGEETLMRDDLRVATFIPLTSPYADAATIAASVLATGGTSGTGVVADDIVDWIWIELRDAADNTAVIAGQSALIQRDGDIVGLDGLSSVAFEEPGTTYYVAIKHRNHLGVVSNATIPLSRHTTVIDFSNSAAQITFGTDAQGTQGMPANVVAMWAGNANGDSQLLYQGASNDSNTIKDDVLLDAGSANNLHSYSAYNNADVNLDGTIRYQGANNDTNVIKDVILSHPDNATNASNLFSVSEQLPEN